MINHLRTLLLNRNGTATGFTSRLGEEYIPPAYRSVELPSYLLAIRRVLYGYSPDWLFENYRTRQYLAMLHSTELIEFVTRLDSRITYDVNNRDMFADSVFGAKVEDNAGTIRFIGQQPAPDYSGQSFRRWRVTVVDDDAVRIERLSPPVSDEQFSYTTDGTWSSPVKLGGDDFFVSFQPETGNKWRVDDIARPQRSLGELAAGAAQIPNGRLFELFGEGTGESDVEPWRTFRNLWRDHPVLAYRLGGLLLAVAYRIEERRTSA